MEREYEAVIGLEVHAELKTKTKIFCACPKEFGGEPNTRVCPVCLGLPGALPTLNRRVVELAVMAGLALHCEISTDSFIDRKQYFYPDLPKAYQISQKDVPLCKKGYLQMKGENGEPISIGIERIHIEEDAGKLVHLEGESRVDYNRCGTPLIEIVSAPDLHSGADAASYLKEMRATLIACGVSDCRMQEGEFRCDVNVSVRKRGNADFGTRTEIKNVNSFSFAEKAIQFEIERQIALLERGESVICETRRYDEVTGGTVRMRSKETAEDYRYLREANLLPLHLEKAEIECLRQRLPELPNEKRHRLQMQYGLAAADVNCLIAEGAAEYFEEIAQKCHFPKVAAHLLLTELLRLRQGEKFPISAQRMGELATLIGERVINSSTAKKLIARLCREDFSPAEVVEREELAQVRDTQILLHWIDTAIEQMPKAVQDYHNGKRAALQALQGKVMALSAARADPEKCEALLLSRLKGEEK